MSHRRSTFRPTVQTLETRRCMAGGLGLEAEVLPAEPAPAETLTISDTTIVGNTADRSYGGFSGGVFVSTGDINGDGTDDIITAAAAGGGPHVRVFDAVTETEAADDLATSPDTGGGPHVKVFDGATDNDTDGDDLADDVIVSAGSTDEPRVVIKTYICPSDPATVDAVFNEVGRSSELVGV